MPEYTYPKIFPDLRENPRDLETWLGANVVNQEEGSGYWAASDHQHADAIRVNSTLATGGSLPTVEADLAYVEVTEGVPAGADLLVDVTVTVEVANVPAGAYWGARVGIQDVAQGSLMYHQGQTHGHTVAVSTAASGSAPSGGTHSHTLSGSSGNANDTHYHQVGAALVVGLGGSTVTNASGSSHTHPDGTLRVYIPEYGYQNVTGDTATTTSHTHGIDQHSHAMSGQTGEAGRVHTHTLGSGTVDNGGAHVHSVSTTGSGSGTAADGGGGLSKDTITVRWVGTASTGEGAIKIAARAACTAAGGTWTKIAVVGVIWIVPTVLAAQLGGLDDLADVSTPSPADSQVLTWSAPAGAWIAEDAAAAVGSNFAARFLLMGG